MQPINVAVRVPQPREQVFAFLDVLSNHEPFTDHMLVDWSYDGPASGVGARARMRAKSPGPAQWLDMEVTASEAPVTTTEEAVSAHGRRRTRGTYRLEALPDGGTEIRFELAYLAMPAGERVFAPLLRVALRRANDKAMRRLATALAERGRTAAARPAEYAV